MATLDALDYEMGGIPSNAAAVFGSIAMNGDEYVRCNRCGYGGCDVRVSGCGCTMHAVSSTRIFLILDAAPCFLGNRYWPWLLL